MITIIIYNYVYHTALFLHFLLNRKCYKGATIKGSSGKPEHFRVYRCIVNI